MLSFKVGFTFCFMIWFRLYSSLKSLSFPLMTINRSSPQREQRCRPVWISRIVRLLCHEVRDRGFECRPEARAEEVQRGRHQCPARRFQQSNPSAGQPSQVHKFKNILFINILLNRMIGATP